MNKPTVIVNKVGSVFHPRGTEHRAGGECGDTDGVLCGLLDRSDLDLAYFGPASGALPEGVRHVNFDLQGVTEHTSGPELRARIKPAIDELRDAKLLINVTGYAGCTHIPDNPWGTQPQACGVRYTAPLMYLCEALNIPRILVNNDPRNYPKEHEMWIIPGAVPVAVLSQEDRLYVRQTYDTELQIKAVRSGSENWWSRCTPDIVDPAAARDGCCIIAHSHFDDARLSRGRDETWHRILDSYAGQLDIYGKHWESWAASSEYYNRAVHGPCKPDQVFSILSKALCGPMIPIGRHFLTGKLREYAIAGACPLPFWLPEGETIPDFTYDGYSQYVPADHWTRVFGLGDLEMRVSKCLLEKQMRCDWVNELERRTRPDFSLLNQCVDHFLAGGSRDDRFGWYKM